MSQWSAIGLRASGLVVAGMLCTGCPNPNTYGTPRTVPVGKLSHSIALEAFGATVKESTTGVTASAALPTFPTYTLRVGVLDSLDVGARVSNLSSIGGDVKWNFIKSEDLDLALDPGVQWFSISAGGASASVLTLHAPLLVGVNLNDSVSLVPTVGVSFSSVSGSISDGNTQDTASASSGPIARGGLGADLRVSPKFALHPELTFLKPLKGPDSVLIYMFGIGFNFGSLPKYGAEAPVAAGNQ